MRSAAAAALTVTAVLWGCATLQPGDDAMTYAQRRDFLTTLDAWDVRGRIAIDTGEEAFQGRFQWSERPGRLELTVRSPLGNTLLRVSGPADQLTVEARGETRELDDPERQLSALLGWWLPVESFRSWLLGVADPDFPARERFGENGSLATLEQRRWRLSFATYALQSGVLLPRRIDLNHAQLELRVVVDDWAPAP